jgi:hypothetical protein
VGEGVFEPAEHAALVCVVAATTMIVVLVVPMGVLRILMPGHNFSSVLEWSSQNSCHAIKVPGLSESGRSSA